MKEDLDYIVDALTGSDGGIAFIRFRMMLESMQAAASNGDKGAKQILEIIRQFRKLIEVAQTIKK